MKRLKTAISLFLSVMMLSACGESEDGLTTTEFNEKLEDGVFYVVNTNGINIDDFKGSTSVDENGEKVASLTTFDGVTVSPAFLGNTTAKNEILWFRKDYDNIPTLYSGDFLVMYTKDVLTEVIDFKRYEDTGYSIGLCNLSETKSGRCMIDLSETDFDITYPDSDADKILDLTNESVILESLGGSPLRFEKEDESVNKDENSNEDEQESDEPEKKSLITDYGTLYLDEISPCMEMDALIYEGTVKHEYTFTSDVRIFGLMDEYECNDFDFISETILRVQIPDWFNSGYYLINDVGLFRYVKETNTYNEVYGKPGTRPSDIDFNVPNIDPATLEDDVADAHADDPNYDYNNPEVSYDPYFFDNEVEDDYAPMGDDVRTDILKTQTAGSVTITAVVDISNDNKALPDIVMTLTTPKGKVYPFSETDEEGVFEIQFTSFNPGEEFSVRTYNLAGRDVKFMAVED